MRTTWTTALCAGLFTLALAMAGCGGSDTTTSGGTDDGPGRTLAATPPDSGCGSVPNPAVKDPDGVVASLPASYKAQYDSSPDPVLESAWRHWKPDHAPPYKVAIVWGPPQSDSQTLTLDAIKKRLEASPLISDVSTSTLGQLNVPAQLQQLAAAAQQDADLIITQPGQPEAFVGPIKKIAATGTPVVTVLGGPPIAEAVNVDSNNYAAAAQTAARQMQIIGGKGNVILAHGVIGMQVDNTESAAFAAVLDQCPDVKKLGDVTGAFSTSTSKSETLKFLGTHPQKIDAVLQVANMAPGVMGAFDQTGRPMPVVGDIGNQKGSLGYWNDHRADYLGVGAGLPPEQLGGAAASVALRMLEGQGVKSNLITQRLPLITERNLDEWVEPGWDLRTVGTALGPDGVFLTEDYLDPLFDNGSTPK